MKSVKFVCNNTSLFSLLGKQSGPVQWAFGRIYSTMVLFKNADVPSDILSFVNEIYCINRAVIDANSALRCSALPHFMRTACTLLFAHIP